MNTDFLDSACDLAGRMASEATPIALSRQRSAIARLKDDGTLVTDVDVAIQNLCVESITKSFPDHAVCAEETLRKAATTPSVLGARYCWVIDPIDGTRNYAHGIPCYSTSIALLENGNPIVGVVKEHNSGQVFEARSGCGARLNGGSIRTRDPDHSEDILLGTAFSPDEMTGRILSDWVRRDRFKGRNFGSTALHLGMIAAGMLTGAYAKQCKIWDLAAGWLLVTEAGGRMTSPLGRDISPFSLTGDVREDIPFLAAAPGTHQLLLDTIRQVTG